MVRPSRNIVSNGFENDIICELELPGDAVGRKELCMYGFDLIMA